MQDGKLGAFAAPFERDRKEVTLPSGRRVTVLETTGREEKILSQLGNVDRYDKINEYLAGVTEGLDGKEGRAEPSAFEPMLTGDRTYILMCARVLTHGPVLTHTLECESVSCGQSSEHEISIQDMIDQVQPYPDGDRREFSVKLDAGVLYFDMPTGKTERKIAHLPDPDLNSKYRCINLWEIVEGRGKLPVEFDNLKSKHINALRKELKSHECRIDTVVTVECPYCHLKSTFDSVGVRGFLFPGST